MTGGLAGVVVAVQVLGPLSFLTCLLLSSPSPELLRGRTGGFINEGTRVRTYVRTYVHAYYINPSELIRGTDDDLTVAIKLSVRA